MFERFFFLVVVVSFPLLVSCASYVELKPKDSEGLVTASFETLKILKNRKDLEIFKEQLSDAAGCAIFPSLYKAGFFVGIEGGNGILIARDEEGNWGYPAFYTLAGGSWGFQFGAQKSGVVFIIRNKSAIRAILEHQGKLGADLSFAIGPIGTGLEGATTTNLAADIYAFSDTKGLFGGISLEGAAMIRRNDLNKEYYQNKATPTAILIEHVHRNSQADLLRASLASN